MKDFKIGYATVTFLFSSTSIWEALIDHSTGAWKIEAMRVQAIALSLLDKGLMALRLAGWIVIFTLCLCASSQILSLNIPRIFAWNMAIAVGIKLASEAANESC